MIETPSILNNTITASSLWQILREEAMVIAASEPVLGSYIHSTILHHQTLAEAISFHLANLLDSPTAPALLLREIFLDVMSQDTHIIQQLNRDIQVLLRSGIKVVFFEMPIHQDLKNLIEPQTTREEFYKYFPKLH